MAAPSAATVIVAATTQPRFGGHCVAASLEEQQRRDVTHARTQGDEARHEAAYQRIVDELLRRDADRAVLAFAGMMRASIVMPAHLLEDGGAGSPGGHEGPAAGESRETAFFKNFAALADSLGVYTAQDYAQVTAHLLKRWRIADVKVRRAIMMIFLLFFFSSLLFGGGQAARKHDGWCRCRAARRRRRRNTS